MSGANPRRSLFNREYGFELAGFERAIIREEDVGFVAKVDRRYRYFRLSPSPFLKCYDTLYIVERGIDLPHKGAFIKVTKYDEKYVRSGKDLIKVKVVREWKFADFSNYLNEKPIFNFDDLWMFLRQMFRSARNIDLESILSSIAVYLGSSPPHDVLRGGLLGIAIVRKANWPAFKRVFDYLIPKEFQKEKAPYYYGYQYKFVDPYLEPIDPNEVCIDYINPPEPTYFHIPQPIVNVDTNPVNKFESLFKDYGGGIAGYMLHYLHLQPKIENYQALNKMMDEITQELRRVDGDVVLPPDFTFLERISKAIARLNLRERVKKDDIDFMGTVWLECYKESLKLCKKSLPLSKYYSLGKDERVIYTLIKDLATNDRVEKRVIVEEGAKIFGDEFYVERLLENLIKKGYLYEPKIGVLEIVDRSQILF